jgi:hypothetical protein
MWGRRKKRGSQLSRQLALGLLEDAMERVQPLHEQAEHEQAEHEQEEQEQEEQEQQEDEPTAPYPSPEYGPTPPGTPARTGLQAADVQVDNSAAPGPPDDPQRQHPARRTGERTRRRSFG